MNAMIFAGIIGGLIVAIFLTKGDEVLQCVITILKATLEFIWITISTFFSVIYKIIVWILQIIAGIFSSPSSPSYNDNEKISDKN